MWAIEYDGNVCWEAGEKGVLRFYTGWQFISE